MGRPGRFESDRRRREFARLVVNGVSLAEAAQRARLDPWRALRLLDSNEMRSLMREARPDMEAVSARDELAAAAV